MIIDFIIEDLMLNSYLQKNFHTLYSARQSPVLNGVTDYTPVLYLEDDDN